MTKAEATDGSAKYSNEYSYANDRLASVSYNTASNGCDVTLRLRRARKEDAGLRGQPAPLDEHLLRRPLGPAALVLNARNILREVEESV